MNTKLWPIGISTLSHARFGKGNPDGLTALTELVGIGYRRFEYSDQSSPAPQDADEKKLKEAVKICQAQGAVIHSIHIPCPQLKGGEDISSLNAHRRQLAIEISLKSIEGAVFLGAENAVIHCYEDTGLPQTDILLRQKLFIEAMDQICSYAKNRHVNILLENTGFAKTAGQLKEMIAIINAPNLYILVDVGHALIDGVEPGRIIRESGELLKGLHLHDNNGKEDEHLVPTEGNINWQDVVKALRDVKYNGVFMLEAAFSKKLPSPLSAAQKGWDVSQQLLMRAMPATQVKSD